MLLEFAITAAKTTPSFFKPEQKQSSMIFPSLGSIPNLTRWHPVSVSSNPSYLYIMAPSCSRLFTAILLASGSGASTNSKFCTSRTPKASILSTAVPR
uniref:Uncharacterized protein n=1 Tax=Arundo donax TaxID=35708 RepID=A0A0A9H2Y8_ARUDO